jgi:hypothetical protein
MIETMELFGLYTSGIEKVYCVLHAKMSKENIWNHELFSDSLISRDVESISHKSHRLLKNLLGRAFPFLKRQSSETGGVKMNILEAKITQLPRSQGY